MAIWISAVSFRSILFGSSKVTLRTITPASSSCFHPARAWRGRKTDALGKFEIGNVAVLLQMAKNAPVQLVELHEATSGQQIFQRLKI